MALNPVDLKIELFLNDARNSYFLEDTTGVYSPNNLEGYGLPGGATINSVTSLTVTLNYTKLESELVYIFTISSGSITACTLAFAGGTPVSIFSQLVSTGWPFTSSNRFEITKDYGVNIPTLDDMVYEVTYEIEGSITAQSFDYSTEIQDLLDVATNCCLSKELIKLDINNLTGQEIALTGYGYLITAHSAVENGNIDQANSYITRAKILCDSMCDCGCN